GYTDDRVVRDAILEPGAHFLEKPFTPEALARAVRKALHETGNSTDQDASRSSPA
ncbi:MAG: glycosyltransferase family 4 protein, partial [Calditrichaeota bacterium]|nr:glycosyltransferase family 4 protein [Calditrichota bacterium]